MVVLTTFDTPHAQSNTVTPRREPEHPVSIDTCTRKSHEHVDQYMLPYFYHPNSERGIQCHSCLNTASRVLPRNLNLCVLVDRLFL